MKQCVLFKGDTCDFLEEKLIVHILESGVVCTVCGYYIIIREYNKIWVCENVTLKKQQTLHFVSVFS